MGSRAFMSRAVPPPIRASRKRSSGRLVSGEWKVIMMIIAEMAASFTPVSSRPRNTARAIARTTTRPACKAPTPTAETRKSAIATPKATPSVSSTARLARSPTARPRQITAAMGAKVGLSTPSTRTERNHAAQAATAVCRICNHAPRKRRTPERRRVRTRTRGPILSRHEEPS